MKVVVFSIIALLLLGNHTIELHKAVMKGDKEKVATLLAEGTNVNAEMGGWTPLFAALTTGHRDVAVLLVEKGASVKAKISSGDTPLSLAVLCMAEEVANFLRQHAEVEGR
ncbi:MAG: ankyrin repeat domain-containing protein [Verrucomicrobia bacterium]|nr:ankyrin repeat domain-containing protein [Verrucomicrobiota bacterium]